MFLAHRHDGPHSTNHSGRRGLNTARTLVAVAIVGLGLATVGLATRPGTAGAATTRGAAASGTTEAQPDPSRTCHGNAHTVCGIDRMTPLTGYPPTWAEIVKIYRFLAPYQALVTRYRDPAAALRAGYVTAPFLNVPGQGAHYIPRAVIPLMNGAPFPPGKLAPPVLVYDPVHGTETLAAIMFVVPATATQQQLAAILPPSLAFWHQHVDICIAGDQSTTLPYHTRAACRKAHGLFSAATYWMAHAWIGQAGDTGLFDMNFTYHRPPSTAKPMLMTNM
jgi:hypothetical protein